MSWLSAFEEISFFHIIQTLSICQTCECLLSWLCSSCIDVHWNGFQLRANDRRCLCCSKCSSISWFQGVYCHGTYLFLAASPLLVKFCSLFSPFHDRSWNVWSYIDLINQRFIHMEFNKLNILCFIQSSHSTKSVKLNPKLVSGHLALM